MSKNKIKLNDLYPYGSGNPFKKGHFNTNGYYYTLEKSKLKLLKEKFQKYDNYDLLTTLAGLHVHQKNHTHIIKLNIAIQVACSIESNSNKKIKKHTFEDIINYCISNESNIGKMEDPPEQLFTDNIVFHGGNYIVYPGNGDEETYILQNLLKTIYLNEEKYPKEFIDWVSIASLSLLTISNEIASRLGHKRYMDSPDAWRKKLKIPNDDELLLLKHAVVFSKIELDELLKPFGYNNLHLAPFIVNAGDDSLNIDEDSFSEDTIDNQLLFLTPLVEKNEKIIVALPNSITQTLRHFILTTALRFNCVTQLVSEYTNILFANIDESLRLMLYKKIKFDLPTFAEKPNIKESIYQIDYGKLVYLQLIVDDASNYKSNEVNGSWDYCDLSEIIRKRDELICKCLLENSTYFCDNVFIVKIVGRIGRIINFKFYINNTMPTLAGTPTEFEVISQIGEFDNLTLWKFTRNYDQKLKHKQILSFSLLDRFAFYYDHNQSLNINQKNELNVIYIFPSYGRALRIKAATLSDNHAVIKSDSSNYVLVTRLDKDVSIPIYYQYGTLGFRFEELVEGYPQPLWIKPLHENYNNPLHKELIFQITEMFSYWLWQFTPGLSPFLRALEDNPITINFWFEDIDQWDFLNIPIKHSGDPHFNVTVKNRTITIIIPSAIIYYLKLLDNSGERLILNSLLNGFNQLLELHGAAHFEHGALNRIIDEYAPLGLKKKIMVVDSIQDGLLIGMRNLKFRVIPDHDLEEQNEALLVELNKVKNINFNNTIKDKTTQLTICRIAVDIYLKRLRSELQHYDWQSVLKQLIITYESGIYYNAYNAAFSPTTIECYSNVSSYVDTISKELPKQNSTLLSLRILIEILSAEPPTGKKLIGTDELDRLLAITFELINWAMISDRIFKNISKVQFVAMNGGRIGIIDEYTAKKQEPFLKAKLLENIESSIETFPNKFSIDNNFENNEPGLEFESAFFSEFGLTLTQIGEFFACLIDTCNTFICTEQAIEYYSLPLSEFKRRLQNNLEWSDGYIELAIKLFSLSPREKWEISPPDFTFEEDISPWKYNRRLSYLRKPIIMGPEPKNDPLIFWGPLHVESSFMYLGSIINNGRYTIRNDTSEPMKLLISKIQSTASNKFVKEVEGWLKSNTNYVVASNIFIKDEYSNEDLGDIDIIAIDKTKKVIYSIECKKVNFGRTPREISNEIDRFIGENDMADSWINKHITRDKWIKNNLDIIIESLKIPKTTYNVKSLLLISQEIPTSYYLTTKLPIIAHSKLLREGIKVLNDI